jgi:N-acetylglucosamine-6-phosphate deacetylase
VPRSKITVKNKSFALSSGVVDLHFHGAFGIDLMTAPPERMTELGRELWSHGVGGFLATTLSTPRPELKDAVARMGSWIASGDHSRGALPLGIHLEGPFISPGACGAHPPGALRELDFEELEELWSVSRGTLKLLTVAPERLTPADLRRLSTWAQARGVVLSLGHSQATEQQAREAFAGGFSGVTHAWNALPFHHRAPGPLGAALGRKGIHVELILDQVHVAPTLIRWTLALHPHGTCFVSDCVPAAATPAGSWHPFGSLRIRAAEGAARLENGALAGGARLLPEAYGEWLASEAGTRSPDRRKLFRKTHPCLTRHPLIALGLKPGRLSARKIRWFETPEGAIRARPAAQSA